MKLYYTGARTFLGEQKLANNSLGGYVSNSPIPNGVEGNLFSAISLMTIDDNSFEMVGIMLKNILLVDVEDILLYFVYPVDTYVKYSIAVVEPGGDPVTGYYMESIQSRKSLPIYVEEFVEADGFANAVNIGNLAAGAYIGIWIKRDLLPNVKTPFTDISLCTNGNPVLTTKDIVPIKLDWTVPSTTTAAPTTTVAPTTTL